MKKILLIIILLGLTSIVKSQVTDLDIANSLLGQHYLRYGKVLDSLGVWYYHHGGEHLNLSIADGDGTVKSFYLSFHLKKASDGRKFHNHGKIYKVVINYRHDSKEQIMDLKKIKAHGDVSIGKFSTDVVIKL